MIKKNGKKFLHRDSLFIQIHWVLFGDFLYTACVLILAGFIYKWNYPVIYSISAKFNVLIYKYASVSDWNPIA